MSEPSSEPSDPTQESGQESYWQKKLVYLIVLAGAILVFLILLVFLCCYWAKRDRKKVGISRREGQLLRSGSSAIGSNIDSKTERSAFEENIQSEMGSVSASSSVQPMVSTGFEVKGSENNNIKSKVVIQTDRGSEIEMPRPTELHVRKD